MSGKNPHLLYSALQYPMKVKRSSVPPWKVATISVLITVGVATLTFWPYCYDQIKTTVFQLSPDSMRFDIWKQPSVPIKMSIYFFNWTNPEDILNKTTKPRFEEIGPYVFIEKVEKVNVRWNDNDTVTYGQRRFWHFDESSSIGPLSDVVCTVNAVALSASFKTRQLNFIMIQGMVQGMKTLGVQIHVVKTVGELLFEGYRDTMIDIARTIPFVPDGVVPNFTKFAWFYERNGTTDFDGTFNVATKMENLGQLQRFNFKDSIPFYNNECNKVRGSVGDLTSPHLSKEVLHIFTTEICTSVPLEFQEESEFDGIAAYKFVIGDRFLDNGTMYPENRCYCTGLCEPSGIFNVSACRYGTPSFVSLPHFYGADPIYGSWIDGIKPDKEKHQFYMKLEPETGVPIEVKARIQLNLMMQPNPKVTLFRDVPKFLFPVFWFDQEVSIPHEYSWKLKVLLSSTTVANLLGSISLVIGFVLLVGAFRKRTLR